MSFGRVIAEARMKAGLSQKDLAARLKKEDGTPISAQYLNDIEHDRRNPPSQFLLRQIAQELDLPLEYLYYVAGQLPPEDRRTSAQDPQKVAEAFRAFRRVLKK